MHDATKVLMGSSGSSDRRAVTAYASDPTTYLAGLAVRLTSAGILSVTKADGRWAGISLGRSLSETKYTSVLRAGELVPVLLELEPARGSVTITSYANLVAVAGDTVTVGATDFTAQSSSVTPGNATFRAATSNTATAASLAAQINAHATAGALVVASIDSGDDTKVNITAKGNTTAGNSIALAYTDNGTATVGATVSDTTLLGGGAAPDYLVIGNKVYFSDTTGKADDPESGATVSDAVYVSGVLSGVQEDGTEVACAYVDMAGGL